MTVAPEEEYGKEGVGYMGEISKEERLNHSPTTMNTTFDDDDPISALQPSFLRPVPAPKVPHYNNTRTRSGWAAPKVPMQHPKGEGPSPALQYFVCHLCYGHEHISPDCILTLRQLTKVIENYEKLTDIEKAAVPSTSYCRVRAALGSETQAQAKTPSSESGTVPRVAKYGIPHYLGNSSQPQPQALLEVPKAQEARSQPSVAGTALEQSEN